LKKSSDGETLMAIGIMVPDLGSSRGKSVTFKVGFFCSGNGQERLARGTQFGKC